jgi:hypothetical protein
VKERMDIVGLVKHGEALGLLPRSGKGADGGCQACGGVRFGRAVGGDGVGRRVRRRGGQMYNSRVE